MPTFNPLVAGVPIAQANPAGGAGVLTTPEFGFRVGQIHLTLIGLVLVATLGLVLLHRAGFQFSVTVGGR